MPSCDVHLRCPVHAVVVRQEVDAAKDLGLVRVHDGVRVSGPVAVFAFHLLEILEVVLDREVLWRVRRVLLPVVEELATDITASWSSTTSDATSGRTMKPSPANPTAGSIPFSPKPIPWNHATSGPGREGRFRRSSDWVGVKWRGGARSADLKHRRLPG